MMAESSPQPAAIWESHGRRWLPTLVAVLVRTLHDGALAFDIATEALAAACIEVDPPVAADEALVELLGLTRRVLAGAAERRRVPAVERRRHRHTTRYRLSLDEQRTMMRLSESRLELPAVARALVEALARDAPPPSIVRQIGLSGLVDAAPLPDREHERHDT